MKDVDMSVTLKVSRCCQSQFLHMLGMLSSSTWHLACPSKDSLP